MPKNTKSSASSATRKKKAVKAAKKTGTEDSQQPAATTAQAQPAATPQRGQKKDKSKKKEPKKKVFIPPAKPKQDVIDPLDSLGIAALLPSDLVVLLRKASKKDVVTRIRALEGLSDWIGTLGAQQKRPQHGADNVDAALVGEELSWERRQTALIVALPSWAHLLPRLAVSPNRRLRQLTVQISVKLFEDASIFGELVAQPALVEQIIGPMLVVAHGPDRLVSRMAIALFESCTTWNVQEASSRIFLSDHLAVLLDHLATIILHHKPAREELEGGSNRASGASTPLVGAVRDAKNRDEVNVEEDAEGTDGRLVAGALGGLAWIIHSHPPDDQLDDMLPLLQSSTIWTSLAAQRAPQHRDDSVGSDETERRLGSLSPFVRISAWNLVRTLVVDWPQGLDKNLEVLGPRALLAAFQESDVLVAQSLRDSFIRLLRARPEVWRLSLAAADENDDGDDADSGDEDDEEDDDGDDDDEDETREVGQNGKEHSLADTEEAAQSLTLFLQYLRAGLCGVASSYTTVILLLSTMPDDVLPPTSAAATRVLHAIYTPADEGTLEGREAQRAFVTAFVECLVWLSGRVAARTSVDSAVQVAGCVKMLWCDYVDDADTEEQATAVEEEARVRRLATFGEERLTAELATCLRKLGGIDATLSQPLLDLCRFALRKSLSSPSVPLEMVCDILVRATEGETAASTGLVQAVHELVRDTTCTTANIVASGQALAEGVAVLVLMVTRLASVQDSESQKALRLAFERLLQRPATVDGQVPRDQLTTFLAAYVLLLGDDEDEDRQQCWRKLLDAVVLDDGLDWSMLRALSRAITGKEAKLSGCYSARLNEAFKQHFRSNTTVSARLLAYPDAILSADTTRSVVVQIAAGGVMASEVPLVEEWLKVDPAHVKQVLDDPLMQVILKRTVELAVLNRDRQAAGLWRLLSAHGQTYQVAKEVLQSQLMVLDRPVEVLVEAVKELEPHVSPLDLLPQQSVLEQLLATACSSPTPATLAISDDFAVLSEDLQAAPSSVTYDAAGLTVLARVQLALLCVLEGSSSSRNGIDALSHIACFAVAAEDALTEPDGGLSHFSPSLVQTTLKGFFQRSVSLSTSILSAKATDADEAWFVKLASVLQGKETGTEETQLMLLNVWQTAGSARVFGRLLKGLLSFSGASQVEALPLLRLAQASEKSKPELARAIFLATKDVVLEAPLYDRLRNQAGADLAAVKSQDAATRGVEMLGTLIALAPPPTSSVSLIPQQRCIFLMQTVQAWFASEYNLPQVVYCRLCQLFVHVLPIVQDMPGSHLDLVIDVLEMNLADVDMSSDLGVFSVYVTLVLLDTLVELAQRSATLRAVWKDRRKEVLDAFRVVVLGLKDGAAVPSASGGRVSTSQMLVEEAIIDVVRQVPATLFKDDLGALIALLQRPSQTSLPVVLYRIMAHNIHEQVKDLVVETAVGGDKDDEADAVDVRDGDGVVNGDATEGDEESVAIEGPLKEPKKLHIHDALVAALQQGPSDALSELAYLLTWLSAFEYFEESSLQLRAAYTTQLQAMQLIEGRLLPLVVGRMGATNDPSRWALDEVFLDDIDASSAASMEVLTVHVFYRALIHTPNLVRDAFFSIKDRQQSTLLRNLTVRHLTPLLSQREFGHLRQDGVLERLQDDSMQIKVLGNSSEVVATYTVDEYPLEIAISMPSDYPLHPVEVRDLRKIGISEGTWRAWILGMRQLIAGRNGLIFDALLLFKRNVEAKFSGYDEDSTCAICYSIVSPTDHSLPAKPCKTCKKKFHASCLYKWVSTSGSSTCPMCRSIL